MLQDLWRTPWQAATDHHWQAGLPCLEDLIDGLVLQLVLQAHAEQPPELVGLHGSAMGCRSYTKNSPAIAAAKVRLEPPNENKLKRVANKT